MTFYSELKLWPYPIAKFCVVISASVAEHLVGGELEVQKWTCVRFSCRGWGLGVTYILCHRRCLNPLHYFKVPCGSIRVYQLTVFLNVGMMVFHCDRLTVVDCVWNVMAHVKKPDFVFRQNGRVHLNRRGASVQSTTCSRGVRISDSNAGYTMFRGSVKSTGYPLHSPDSPSLPSHASPRAIIFQLESTVSPVRTWWGGVGKQLRKCSLRWFLLHYF